VQVEGLGQGDKEVSEAVQVASQALEEFVVGGVGLEVEAVEVEAVEVEAVEVEAVEVEAVEVEAVEVEAVESRFGIQKLKLKQLLIQHAGTQPELQYVLLQSGLLIVLKVQ
jgi:hypothetical protein